MEPQNSSQLQPSPIQQPRPAQAGTNELAHTLGHPLPAWTVSHTPPHIGIHAGAQCYTLGKQLGKGSYATVNEIRPTDANQYENITYRINGTLLSSNHYVIKLPYSNASMTTKLSQETIDVLKIQHPDRTDIVHSSPVQVESLRLFNMESSTVSGSNQESDIQRFIQKRQKEHEHTKAELQYEADKTKQYHSGSPKETMVQLLESDPLLTVEYDLKNTRATLKYQLALALLLPKESGMTLFTFHRRIAQPTFTLHHLFAMCYKLLTELNNLHKKNLLHGDISPSNIMTDQDQVQFIDFGTQIAAPTAPNQAHKTAKLDHVDYQYWRPSRFFTAENDTKFADIGKVDDIFAMLEILQEMLGTFTHSHPQTYKDNAQALNDYYETLQHTLRRAPATMAISLSQLAIAPLFLFKSALILTTSREHLDQNTRDTINTRIQIALQTTRNGLIEHPEIYNQLYTALSELGLFRQRNSDTDSTTDDTTTLASESTTPTSETMSNESPNSRTGSTPISDNPFIKFTSGTKRTADQISTTSTPNESA